MTDEQATLKLSAAIKAIEDTFRPAGVPVVKTESDRLVEAEASIDAIIVALKEIRDLLASK